jgi:hypothetical protein
MTDDKCIMKWKGQGRKKPWTNLRHYPGSLMEEMRKT